MFSDVLFNYNLFSHNGSKKILAPNITAPNALASTSPAWGGDVVAVGGKVAMMPISLGTADFMVHHIHALPN
jgi:hypothetical protein